jgi:short-subunit dehydrogenase
MSTSLASVPSKHTALVTGASGGIGEDLARLFAADGHDVVLVARSEGKLEALAASLEKAFGIRAHVVASDLTAPGAPELLLKTLEERGIEVDVLVNNAGYGGYGPFVETDLPNELAMIQLNVTALVHLTKLVLPRMVAKKFGRVMNVASTAAFQPGPLMAVYYATKAFVLSFSEALSNELEGTGVSVTCLCPGATATGFQTQANMEKSRLFKLAAVMDSATVAKVGYRAMWRGKAVVIPGVQNRIMATSVRFFPRKTVTRLVRTIQAPTA